MKRTNLFLVLVAAASTLAACGGGGSDEENKPADAGTIVENAAQCAQARDPQACLALLEAAR